MWDLREVLGGTKGLGFKGLGSAYGAYLSCLGLQISGIRLNTEKVCKASLGFRGLGCNTPV